MKHSSSRILTGACALAAALSPAAAAPAKRTVARPARGLEAVAASPVRVYELREPREEDPWRSRQARYSCAATSNRQGWDEHCRRPWDRCHGDAGPDLWRSSNYACSDCVDRHRHRDCSVRCTAEVPAYRCVAQFVPEDGGEGKDYPGREKPDAAGAEDSAKLECLEATRGRPGRCRIRDCETRTEQREVLTDRCRR